MDTSKLVLWKTLCELRYEATPRFFDVRGTLAERGRR